MCQIFTIIECMVIYTETYYFEATDTFELKLCMVKVQYIWFCSLKDNLNLMSNQTAT